MKEEQYRAFFADAYADALRFAQRRAAASVAEDAVAEAMLVAWRRFADGPTDASERRAWLFGIVRKSLLNAARAETRQAALTVKLIDTDSIADSPDHADRVAQRVDLSQAWGRLEPAHQEALALSILDDLSAPEAARVLGISSVAFRARLSRARRALDSHFTRPRPVAARTTVQEATS